MKKSGDWHDICCVHIIACRTLGTIFHCQPAQYYTLKCHANAITVYFVDKSHNFVNYSRKHGCNYDASHKPLWIPALSRLLRIYGKLRLTML